MTEATPLSSLRRLGLWVAYRLLLVYWFIARPATQGAYVAIWVSGRVLMVKNSYRPIWTLPSGGVEKGESALDAALRETLEEVGIELEPQSLRHVGSFENGVEFKRDLIELYEVRLAHEPRVQVDGVEVIEARFLETKAALRLHLIPAVRGYLESARHAG